MKISSLAFASLFLVSVLPLQAQFATAVVDYTPGTGFAPGYTNAAAALGTPAVGATVTPFGPAYSKSQLVSLGTNGSLTLRFDPPIVNNPANPFGQDFLIFGNTFFAITNGNYSGGGITSGVIGGNNPGATRVEVSGNGTAWFVLNPALAPTADNLYPTDGLGDPGLPVDPALVAGNFAGLGLAGIRGLYQGSAGGTGYDLAWAQDGNGLPVNLPLVRFVRVTVESGKSEIDAVASVRGVTPAWADDFVTDPARNGWKTFGGADLFHWNPTNECIEVTWDTERENSYFYHPLGTILTRDDAFSLAFDLQLNDVAVTNGGSQVAVGLFNFAEATQPGFSRPSINTPDLFELDYYPDTGYGDSISATLADRTVNATNYSDFYFSYDNLPLQPGVTYQVKLTHDAGLPSLRGEVFTNGVLYTALGNVYAGPIADFRLDTVAISSYAGDGFGDDLLAHGTVKNFLVSLPPFPAQNFSGAPGSGGWQGQFGSRSNWVYALERTTDLASWTGVGPTAVGTGTNLTLVDPNPPAARAFYRVNATRP